MNFRNKLFTRRVWWEDNIGFDYKRIAQRSGIVAERHGKYYFVDVDSTPTKVSMRVHVNRVIWTLPIVHKHVLDYCVQSFIARQKVAWTVRLMRIRRRLHLMTLPDVRLRGAARLKWFPQKVTSIDRILAQVTKLVPLQKVVVPADGMRELFDRRGVPLTNT